MDEGRTPIERSRVTVGDTLVQPHSVRVLDGEVVVILRLDPAGSIVEHGALGERWRTFPRWTTKVVVPASADAPARLRIGDPGQPPPGGAEFELDWAR